MVRKEGDGRQGKVRRDRPAQGDRARHAPRLRCLQLCWTSWDGAGPKQKNDSLLQDQAHKTFRLSPQMRDSIPEFPKGKSEEKSCSQLYYAYAQ